MSTAVTIAVRGASKNKTQKAVRGQVDRKEGSRGMIVLPRWNGTPQLMSHGRRVRGLSSPAIWI